MSNDTKNQFSSSQEEFKEVDDTSETATNEKFVSTEPEDKWLIRDCDTYDDEYSECTSAKGRFQQYFVYGDTIDCNQWKKDYDNCCKWVDHKDIKAAEALINSEKARRQIRLRAHYRNDVWKKRESPPEDWSKPLPEWMVKRDENTYLAQVSKDMKDQKIEEKQSFCSIM